jgi:hypothetical protein
MYWSSTLHSWANPLPSVYMGASVPDGRLDFHSCLSRMPLRRALQEFPSNCTAEELSMPVPHHFTFHGGGGTILSVGLLRQLNWTQWQECVSSMRWRQGERVYARASTTAWHSTM